MRGGSWDFLIERQKSGASCESRRRKFPQKDEGREGFGRKKGREEDFGLSRGRSNPWKIEIRSEGSDKLDKKKRSNSRVGGPKGTQRVKRPEGTTGGKEWPEDSGAEK